MQRTNPSRFAKSGSALTGGWTGALCAAFADAGLLCHLPVIPIWNMRLAFITSAAAVPDRAGLKYFEMMFGP